MIVKKMKRTSFKKSKAVMISELVDYIFSSHDDQGKEKLAHSGTLIFLTTTRAAQKNEMIALAEEQDAGHSLGSELEGWGTAHA